MSRMTKRNYPNRRLTELRKNGLLKIDLSYSHVEAITNKLADYEDLEEQGYKMIDVESVAEQLKNEKEIVKSLITPRGGRSFYEGTLRGLNKALKIVRGEVK